MRVRRWRPLTPIQQRRVARAFQVLILAVLGIGLLTRNPSVVVNGAVALVVTELPALLERDHQIVLSPGLSLLISVTVTLHAVGMLGLYARIVWWDHLTHTLSAAIVAAVGYATATALDHHADGIHLPAPFLAIFVLLFTLAFGVLWEVLEFVVRGLATAGGFEPVLIQYGLADTILDLFFDAIGAVIVAIFGAGRLSGLVEELIDRFEERSGS